MATLDMAGIITRVCTDLKEKFSKVTVSRSLTSGTKSATVTVDGTAYDLYAPTPPTASTTAPSMDGTASYGSGTSYARSNHVHPTDTSRAPASHTHDYLPLSGGTLTGDLAMDDCDVDVEGGYAKFWHPEIVRGTAPASDIYGGGGALKLTDKNGNQIGFIQPMQLANGIEAIQLGVGNSDSSDWNTLAIGYDGNGNKYVNVSGQTEWRNAISAAAASHTHSYLPLSGGTMTGDLDMDGAALQYDSETAYPIFTRSSWSVSSDESTLPVTPCIVLDTTSHVTYFCSGSGINSLTVSAIRSDSPGTDLNDMKAGETWWGENLTNAPESGWVQATRINTMQLALKWVSTSAEPRMYVRTFTNYVWTPWARLDNNAIGTTVQAHRDTNFSVATSTYKSIESIALTAGTWVIAAGCQFASNATGRRFLGLWTAADTAPSDTYMHAAAVSSTAVNGAATRLHTSMIVAPSSSSTMYLTLWQNSGSALNCMGYIRAVRIA